jgi:hypothetical protein
MDHRKKGQKGENEKKTQGRSNIMGHATWGIGPRLDGIQLDQYPHMMLPVSSCPRRPWVEEIF